MAKAYRDYKVSELKEILGERGLTVSGTKPELIARLEEHDATNKPQESEAEATETEPKTTEPAPESTDQEATTTTEATEATEATESTESTEPAVDPTEAAIKDLEKRIARLERFGEAPEELVQQLARIKRFGYVPPAPKPKLARNGRNHRNKRQGSKPAKVSK